MGGVSTLGIQPRRTWDFTLNMMTKATRQFVVELKRDHALGLRLQGKDGRQECH